MPVTIETATVYRGGGRRWLSAKTACKKEAQAVHKARFASKCECDEPEYEGPFQYYPGNTCTYHVEKYYTTFVRRVARMIERSIKEIAT